jgi:two-component system response regulator PilR (NtrC family)
MAPLTAAALRVLVVDDEPSLRDMLTIALRRVGAQVTTANGVQQAARAIAAATPPFPLVITDLMMPDGSGMDVLGAAKKHAASTEVIVMTAHSTVEAAIEAMRAGAYDFVVKPFSPAQMIAQAEKALEKHALSSENQRLRAQLERHESHDLELGASPKMREVADLIDKIATAKTTVLITGESGTGKERVARLIHAKSERSAGPFRVINCGALPEALMESELFGHVKGAFTGAVAAAPGLVKEADGGTLLLDEVGELPASLQVKLLRVLQERKVRPVGGTAEIPVDVRLLAATNRDVEAEVKAGRFRQDLYYRLNVIRIPLPALRERPGDVGKLSERFLARFAAELGKSIRGFTPEALRALDHYDFPGNVRELENMIERAVALSSGSTIGLGDLPEAVSGVTGLPLPLLLHGLPSEGVNLDEVLGEVERRLILEALERSHGVRKGAAKLLGVTFRSLRYRLEKLGLDVGESAEDERESSPTPSSR